MPTEQLTTRTTPAPETGGRRSDRSAATPRVRRGGAAGLLRMLLASMAVLIGTGCIQDTVLIRTNFIEGRIIPTGVLVPPPTTAPGSVVFTVNVTVPTVGVRLNTVGSGTLVSIIQPIGPQPGSLEFAFASVTGDFRLETQKNKTVKVVARGVEYDVGWGSVFFEGFNEVVRINNLDSVTLPLVGPLRNNGQNNLVQKVAGRAAFLLFSEDFLIRGVPVRSARVLIDDFSNAFAGLNLPDDGSLDFQNDRGGADPVSFDLLAGDGVFTRVRTGLTAGEHTYGFVINNDGIIRRDPYEEKSKSVSGTRRSVIIVK